MMRSYPLNSPQAAARIVTLAMLADRRLGSEEMLMLDYLRAPEQLGLSVHQLDVVVEAFRHDLGVSPPAESSNWADACLVDPRTMEQLMAEIDDPALRRKVLRICVSVVEADGRVHDSESIVLNAAVEQWGLHRAMFQTRAAERPIF